MGLLSLSVVAWVHAGMAADAACRHRDEGSDLEGVWAYQQARTVGLCSNSLCVIIA